MFVVLRGAVFASEEKEASEGSERESHQTLQFQAIEVRTLVGRDFEGEKHKEQKSEKQKHGLN